MADVKISAMPSVGLPLKGSAIVPIVQDGANGQASVASLASVPYVQVTLDTLAAGIALDLPNVNTLYAITTDGTGSDQNIDIPLPSLDVGGFANIDLLNMRLCFLLQTQTDGGDQVTFTINGSPDYQRVPDVAGGVSLYSGVVQNFQYSLVSFVWAYSQWVVDGNMSSFQFSSGTQQDTASARLESQALNGNVYIAPSATGGQAFIQNIPTADPHISGAIWNSAGALKVSAG